MASIRRLSPKILSALYHQFMRVDPDRSLSIEEVTAKIKLEADEKDIHAGLKYLTHRHYIQTTSKTSYQITPDGIDYYEELMNSDTSGKATVIVHGDNNNGNGSGNIIMRFPKLGRPMRRRIFDVLTQVGEIYKFLKKQNLFNEENEKKFKDWYCELENIIRYRDFEKVPPKQNRDYPEEEEL